MGYIGVNTPLTNHLLNLWDIQVGMCPSTNSSNNVELNFGGWNHLEKKQKKTSFHKTSATSFEDIWDDSYRFRVLLMDIFYDKWKNIYKL